MVLSSAEHSVERGLEPVSRAEHGVERRAEQHGVEPQAPCSMLCHFRPSNTMLRALPPLTSLISGAQMVRSAGLNGHGHGGERMGRFVDVGRFVDATPSSIVRPHELGRLHRMVGIAARRRGSFELWLHTQSNAKQPSPSVLQPSHYSVESAKAGDGARCRAQLIGPSSVREPDAHRPG